VVLQPIPQFTRSAACIHGLFLEGASPDDIEPG
jgi:hypothetical protein